MKTAMTVYLVIGDRELTSISQLTFTTEELRTDNFESFVPEDISISFEAELANDRLVALAEEAQLNHQYPTGPFKGFILGTWYIETHWTKRHYKVVRRRQRKEWRRYQRQKRKQ